MNLRLLRIFQSVCRQGSITGAAGALHMAQPAVSQAIKALEEETGLALFDRLGRRIYLTEAGRAYLDRAEALLRMSDALDASTKTIPLEVPLRLGVCMTIAQSSLAGMLQAFAARHVTPVRVDIAVASRVLAMLTENHIDLALYEGPQPPRPYASRVFSSYALVPVCAATHPFAERTVPLDDFLAAPLLLREPGSAIRDVLDSFLRLKGLRANPVVTSVNSQALLRLCAADIGVGIVADAVLPEDMEGAGLAAFAVEGMELVNENRVVYHEDKVFTGGMEGLVSILFESSGVV